MVLSSLCHAKSIAEMPNKGGGKVIITNELCRDKVNHLAYSYMAGQSTLGGCWVNDEIGIHIKWYDGDLRFYPYENWKMIESKETNL